jgi:protein O-mannosyl-transferase
LTDKPQLVRNSAMQKQKKKQKTISNPVAVQQKKTSGKFIVLSILTLVLLTCAVYMPALHNQLTNWDDDAYIYNNAAIGDMSAQALTRDFSSFVQGNYHPLTMVSLKVSYALGKYAPFVYIGTNILLHCITTILVFLFLLVLVKNRSIALITALLFGIHPLHVESVVWASERKDVLYAAFFFASLLLYTMYAQKGRWLFYGISLIVFCCSLLSKGQAVTLPVVLIMIDMFMQRPLRSSKVIAEKIPFFVVALIAGVTATIAQKTGGAVHDVLPLDRIPVACSGFTLYLFKLMIPVHLSAFYPYPIAPSGTLPPLLWLYVIPVCAVIWLFVRCLRKKQTLAAFGLAFFMVNVFLVLQLLPVGRACMAERYTYVASTGIFLILALGISRFIAQKKYRTTVLAVFIVYCSILTAITLQRIAVWHDSITLWSDVLDKFPNVFEAYANRGIEKMKRGDIDGAITDCSRSIAMYPDNAPALSCNGLALYKKSQQTTDPAAKHALMETAVHNFTASFAITPHQINERQCLADCYQGLGNFKEAVLQFDTLRTMTSITPAMLNNIAFCYFQAGIPDSVIRYAGQALAMDSANALAWGNMGLAHQMKNNYPAAAACYERAINLNPGIDQAYIRNCVSIYSFLKNNAKAAMYARLIK